MPILRYAGFAEEAEAGETPAPAAAFHVDIASASLDVPDSPHLVYEGGLSRGARTHRPGAYHNAGDVVYAADMNTLIYLLKWASGGYAFTADPLEGDANVQEFWTSARTLLDPFCARIGKDHFEHVFHGCIIDSFQLEVDNGFVQATANIVAQKDSKAALQAVEDLLLPEAYPMAFHEVTATLDGTSISAKVKNLTLQISNGADASSGMRIGSRHPGQIPVFSREVTLDMELAYDDTTELERYWGDELGPAADGTTEFGLELTFDSGDHGVLDIALPRSIYQEVPTTVSGTNETTQSSSVKSFLTEHTLADGTTSVTAELLATLVGPQADISLS